MQKPKIYKQNGLWHCQYKQRVALGNTPKQAYTAMQWVSKNPIVLDDTLIIRREV